MSTRVEKEDGRGFQPQGGNVTGLGGIASNDHGVKPHDDQMAAAAAADEAWAKQGRTLAKPSVVFAWDEVQVLTQANWQPFFQPDGRPYCETSVKHAKQHLIACAEDMSPWATILGEERFEKARASLIGKVAAMAETEVAHLIRVMDAFWYNCQTMDVEDFFAIEDVP